MGKRQEEAKITRRKIIDAMKELSFTRSYDDILIDDIVQAAGIARGTFYIYFKRKEDVCAEIVYEKFQALAEDVSAMKINAIDKISYFLKASTVTIEQLGVATSQQWFKAVVAPAANEKPGMRKFNIDLSFIKKCLGETVLAGEMGNLEVEALGKIIVSEFYGAIVVWCMSDGEVKLKDIVEDFCDNVLPGLGK